MNQSHDRVWGTSHFIKRFFSKETPQIGYQVVKQHIDQ